MELYNISDPYGVLKSMEPLTVATHRDADGVYSLALLSKVFDVAMVNVPDLFGDYNEGVSLDLGPPLNRDWRGISIDHHEHSVPPSYALIRDNVPTGLIVYNLFKDRISREHTWLLAGSLVGDGSPELIPPEIFDQHPILKEERGSLFKSYGKLNHYRYPLYTLLASPVNATCRTGRGLQAVQVLLNCRSPEEVLEHPIFIEDQFLLEQEVERVFDEFGKERKARRKTIIIGPYLIISFSSKFFIASRIASEISRIEDLTVIALNEERGEISIRGVHGLKVKETLTKMGWKIGGHPGYLGGELGGRTPEEFIRDLRKMVYREI